MYENLLIDFPYNVDLSTNGELQPPKAKSIPHITSIINPIALKGGIRRTSMATIMGSDTRHFCIKSLDAVKYAIMYANRQTTAMTI